MDSFNSKLRKYCYRIKSAKCVVNLICCHLDNESESYVKNQPQITLNQKPLFLCLKENLALEPSNG